MNYSYTPPSSESPVVGKVCKHAVYVPSKRDKLKDMTFIKQTTIHENGDRTNQFLKVPDYVRPFYIVKEKYRKFEQKKDYIDKRLVKQYKSTQARLAMNIKRVLYGINDRNADLMAVKANPYVFGCETSVPVLVKRRYFERYPDYQETEPATLAAYDVETDMVNGEGEDVIMASTTMKEKIYFAVVRSFFEGMSDEDILDGLKKSEEELIGERLRKRGATVVYEIVDNQTQCVENNIKCWHMWEPDFISSWNASYDMVRNEHALNLGGRDLEEVYTDPSIPREFRYYQYHEGRTHKRKENGDSQPLEWQERYPTVRAAARWQWLDGASFYAIKNAPKGKKESYSLEFTAQDNGIEGKLYTDKGSHLTQGKAAWHRWMQKNAKFEYCMYNISDNLVIEEMDEKTNDIALNLPLLLKSTEFFDYPSQPKCISNELSFIAEEHGYIWGTKGRGGKKDELDQHKPTLGDWIALLETEKNADNGKAVFIGMPGIRSRGRGLTDDIDVEGAYPTATVALNISNKTTKIEACAIQGLNPIQFREVGVNYASSPKANAVSLCATLHRFPGYEEMDEIFPELYEEEFGEPLALAA
ncbi:hypothetical protein [Vibrio phage 2 TSL-2019]|uniref:DNA polymerase n=1 Tax=Vibrio phage 2 TSL-2019 TaxID=2508172 RepID=A0A513PWN0_9CAUD|nr:DNA polymerase [Vibrio phage 2 TSL-2019]QAU04339.1 hypothetical protein [Vibrio phage 2 TSL-2019]